ncbi:hypothetical protein PHYC_02949 [Phycisphaerales bacterium]|nr:hypothetical protein PHYC_02949 [Phycisphaerales bacterium]
MARDPDELDENPSESDVEAFGDATVTCPECGASLYDDVQICWKCGHALSGAAKGPRPWVIWVAIAMVALFMVGLLASAIW